MEEEAKRNEISEEQPYLEKRSSDNSIEAQRMSPESKKWSKKIGKITKKIRKYQKEKNTQNSLLEENRYKKDPRKIKIYEYFIEIYNLRIDMKVDKLRKILLQSKREEELNDKNVRQIQKRENIWEQTQQISEHKLGKDRLRKIDFKLQKASEFGLKLLEKIDYLKCDHLHKDYSQSVQEIFSKERELLMFSMELSEERANRLEKEAQFIIKHNQIMLKYQKESQNKLEDHMKFNKEMKERFEKPSKLDVFKLTLQSDKTFERRKKLALKQNKFAKKLNEIEDAIKIYNTEDLKRIKEAIYKSYSRKYNLVKEEIEFIDQVIKQLETREHEKTQKEKCLRDKTDNEIKEYQQQIMQCSENLKLIETIENESGAELEADNITESLKIAWGNVHERAQYRMYFLEKIQQEYENASEQLKRECSDLKAQIAGENEKLQQIEIEIECCWKESPETLMNEYKI